MSQIEFNAIKSKNTIEYVVEKLPNITLITAALLRLILLSLVAYLEGKIFWEKYGIMAFIVASLIIILDVIFTLTSVITARFWYGDTLKFIQSKAKKYALAFFLISVFGTFFSIWRLLVFSEIFEVGQEGQFVLKFILIIASLLAFIFSEGGAFMLFAFSFKEEAKTETAEIRNTETDANATFQTFLDYCKEAGLDKSEEKILPDVISKISDNLYLIDNVEKTYEQIGGLKRSYKSKMNEEIENKSFEKGFQKFQIFQYWETIENIIKKNNEEYPTGTWSENVKVPEPYEQKEPKINRNKKPEYSK